MAQRTTSLYKNSYRQSINPGKTLPRISTDLDSVKVNQFEIQFTIPPSVDLAGNSTREITDLTLAAKQVQGLQIETADIEVRRLNDTVYYPGKVTPQPLVVTFDNLYLKRTSDLLWTWFNSIYDPITGEMTKSTVAGTGNTFKAMSMRVLELDNKNFPVAYIDLYGVYPSKVKFSDKQYSGEVAFSTIEVTFRYDFIDYSKLSTGSRVGGFLGNLVNRARQFIGG